MRAFDGTKGEGERLSSNRKRERKNHPEKKKRWYLIRDSSQQGKRQGHKRLCGEKKCRGT